MQHFSEITNYPPPYPPPIRPPYSEPPQFRQILEPVSVLPLLASSSARPQAAALRDIQPVPQEDQLDQCEVACNALRELFPVFKSLGTKAS